ncbi:MAG TPA: hypothetical protein VHT03_07755 [Rhizomicrobium sp.]|jgi:hypothetical protein|nr:hypothetical protein [Rhizomicrobium sp.]
MRLGQVVNFTQDVELPFTLKNFWACETNFVWSTRKWCELLFDFEGKLPDGSGELSLDLDAFKAGDEFGGQTVFSYLNGLRIGSNYIDRRKTILIPLEFRLLKISGNMLVFDTPDACAPSEFGSPDRRQLGIQLFSLCIRQVRLSDEAPGPKPKEAAGKEARV